MSQPAPLPPQLARITANRDFVSTAEFARALNRSASTVRKNTSLTGNCFGVKPRRVGGRLLWAVSDIARLLRAE